LRSEPPKAVDGEDDAIGLTRRPYPFRARARHHLGSLVSRASEFDVNRRQVPHLVSCQSETDVITLAALYGLNRYGDLLFPEKVSLGEQYVSDVVIFRVNDEALDSTNRTVRCLHLLSAP